MRVPGGRPEDLGSGRSVPSRECFQAPGPSGHMPDRSSSRGRYCSDSFRASSWLLYVAWRVIVALDAIADALERIADQRGRE